MLSLCQKNQFYQVCSDPNVFSFYWCATRSSWHTESVGDWLEDYYTFQVSFEYGAGLAQYHLLALSVLSHHFHRRRPLAMGVASAGSALGSTQYSCLLSLTLLTGATVHPIIINNLIHGPLGFANGVRISAAVVTGALILCVLCTRTRLPPKKGGASLPFREFAHDPPYVLVVVGWVVNHTPLLKLTLPRSMLLFCGMFFATFFIQLNALDHGKLVSCSASKANILKASTKISLFIRSPFLMVPVY